MQTKKTGLFRCLFACAAASLLAPLASAQMTDEGMLVPLTDVSTNKLPYIVAMEEGIFDKYLIDIKLYLTPHAAEKGGGDGMAPNPEYVMNPETDRLLSTGGGVGQVMRRVRDGGDRVILATTGTGFNYWLYARPGIETLEDLEGKTISATGQTSCTGAVVHIIADRMGWEVGEQLTLVENHEHRVDKMLDGTYDAVILTELPQIYAESIGLEPLVDLREWDLPFVCSGISASKAWLESGDNRELAKRFIMATVEAIALMKQDPAVVRRALDKWYGVRDPEALDRMIATVDMLPRKPWPSVAGIELIMQTYDGPAMEGFSAEDFYDDSLMRELDESGFIDALYE